MNKELLSQFKSTEKKVFGIIDKDRKELIMSLMTDSFPNSVLACIAYTLSVDAKNKLELGEYETKLKHHDWHFERSDDPEVFRAGQKKEDELVALSQENDSRKELWLKYCKKMRSKQ